MTDRRQTVALGILTLAALALRLVHLTRFELFVDEAATWWFAQLTAAGRLAEQMSLEPTPPLYYALVGGVMQLFGESDLAMRLPSAIFGAAAIPMAFCFARALLGPRVAWIAALLLAIHPLHVFYSREARVYPLLLLLTLATLWALWRALEQSTRRAWAWVCGLLILVCYSHFYGLFLAATVGVIVLLWGTDGKTRLHGAVAVGLALMVFLPYVAVTFPHLQESGAAWSIETFYRDLPEEKRLGRVVEMQLVGADYHAYLRQLDQPPTPAALRLAALLAQLTLIGSALHLALRRQKLRQLGFLLVAWLLPILLPWAVTHLGR
ncbi:MAG: glycosyltransferase family 39 protein, partial [Acidobacteriota bacterium]